MASKVILICLSFTLLINWLAANSIVPLIETPNKQVFGEQTLNRADNEMANALVDYLLSRSLERASRGLEPSEGNEMQKKNTNNPNTYFKQCSFNAVSCFGRRRRK